MSCWMTGTRELAILAKYVTETVNESLGKRDYRGIGVFATSTDLANAFGDCLIDGYCEPRKVYESLYRLNEAAYCDRYASEQQGDVPLMPDVTITTQEETRSEWQVRLYWLLQFFLYQTAEGDVTKDARRLALRDLADRIANRIAYEAAKEKGLKWGQF